MRHAKQTGHAEFEEWIPQPGEVVDIPEEVAQPKKYTDEEREARVAALQAQIKQKKELKKDHQEQESLAKELNDRENAKAAQETREKLAEEKRVRDLENARKEKLAEADYQAKVKARLAEAQRQRELEQGGAKTGPAPQPVVKAEPQTIQPAKKAADHTECTIQIRQGNSGKPLVAKFAPTDTIATVARYLEANRTDGQRGPFVLSTPNPKRDFNTPDLMTTTLLDAQLVPRGVLMMVTK